jgi:phosphate transport system substrate-binding protein
MMIFTLFFYTESILKIRLIKGVKIYMKKIIILTVALAMVVSFFTGCGGNSAQNTAITVISREDGSGTRGAFIELVGVEEKDADGNKIDKTIDTAEIVNSTSVVMTTVAGNENAIGYISLGSLDDSVKALKIDGAEATVDNIKSGTYAIARPFNIATKGDVSDVAQDFIKFIMSSEGQKVVEDNGYISQGNTGAYDGNKPSGKITVAGSSSVTPVMEKLKEAYLAINPNAEIEVQQSDSTTGMTSAIEGVCDIGMASRELKDSEIESGLNATVIAMDGIAIIVNNNNTVDGLTSEQVKAIYTGEITDWSELK